MSFFIKMKWTLLILTSFIIDNYAKAYEDGIPSSPILTAYPCNDTRDIIVTYDPTLPPKERNQYYLYANKSFPMKTNIEVKFNADVNIIMNVKTAENTYMTHSLRSGKAVEQRYRTSDPRHYYYGYKVKGTSPGSIPYLTSFKIDNVEHCNQPNVGFLGAIAANTIDEDTSLSCGRRKVEYIELIVNGAETKPGDWPWHVAINKFQRRAFTYICGGTLLSTHFVLTAAHCATERGAPLLADILTVILGKYNLYGGDVGSQEREVHRVIVHEDYQYRYLHNDIALLKLKTEIIFTDYIQPACLWYSRASEKLLNDEIIGTVVGWGFDSSDSLSRTIRRVEMPMVSQSVCMASNPNMYTAVLNEKKFCAGYRNNQTSACNGDSGSAFQVFIPDKVGRIANTRSSGTWLVRGIVSLAPSREDAVICDPNQYGVYTDVAEYLPWIQYYLKYE